MFGGVCSPQNIPYRGVRCSDVRDPLGSCSADGPDEKVPLADEPGFDELFGGSFECHAGSIGRAFGDAAFFAVTPPQVLGDAWRVWRDMFAGRRDGAFPRYGVPQQL